MFNPTKLRNHVLSAAWSIALWGPASALAQSALADTIESLDAIQITATREPERVDHVPASISVISGSELRARGLGRCQVRMQLIVLEARHACKIKAIDIEMPTAIECCGRVDAIAARRDSIERYRLAHLGDGLLHQRFHHALVIALRGVQLVLALDDDGDIGRRHAGIDAWWRGDAKHQPQLPALRIGRAEKTDTQSAVVGPRSSFAL